MTIAPEQKLPGGSGRRSAIDGQTTRHAGYAASQRIRKRIEEAFGWAKSVAGLRKAQHRALAKVDWQFTLAMAAYNLVPLPKLLRPASSRRERVLLARVAQASKQATAAPRHQTIARQTPGALIRRAF